MDSEVMNILWMYTNIDWIQEICSFNKAVGLWNSWQDYMVLSIIKVYDNTSIDFVVCLHINIFYVFTQNPSYVFESWIL